MFWKKSKPPLSLIVSEKEAKTIPYPYVHVEDDGTVRELHANERKNLETPFHPADGSRPHVKNSYNQKNAVGSMRGYCLRSKIPSSTVINDPPAEYPSTWSEQEVIEHLIKLSKEQGFEPIKDEEGKLIFQRKKQDKPNN
jgi:hypothetical protein